MSKNQKKYFKHYYYAKDNFALKAVMNRYGWEGYGLYFGIVELLWSNKQHKIAYNNYNLEELAIFRKTAVEQIKTIIDYMINGETICGSKIQLLKTDGEYIWSDRIFRELGTKSDLSIKRSNAGKKGMQNRYNKNGSNHLVRNNSSEEIHTFPTDNKTNKIITPVTEKVTSVSENLTPVKKYLANDTEKVTLYNKSYQTKKKEINDTENLTPVTEKVTSVSEKVTSVRHINKDIYINNNSSSSSSSLIDEELNNNNNNSFDKNKFKQGILEYFQVKSKYTILEEENIELLAMKFILKHIEPKITNNQSLGNWKDEADVYILTSIQNSKVIDHTGKYDPEKIKLRKLLDKFPNPQNVIINGFVYNFNGEKMATYYHNDKHHTRYFKDVLELYLKEPNNYKLEIDGELINAN